MKKIIRRIRTNKEVGATLIVALQVITVALLGLLGLFASKDHNASKAASGAQTSPSNVAGGPESTIDAKAARRAAAVFGTKLSGLRGTEVFTLATTRAASRNQSDLPSEATLTTDQEDYQPYTYVYISGTGFAANETVDMIVVQLSPNPASYEPWQVVADANGNFETSWYVFSEDLIGATMQVTATGETSNVTASAVFTDAVPPKGVAPVNPPTGGFAIDGDLLSNTPTSPSPFAPNQGDWYAGPGGSGGNVLNSDATGTPVNSATTFHLVDAYNSATDDNFAGGDKVDNNPNAWNWTLNPVNAKQDINNALIHVTKDPITQHTWIMIAGDRLSNNGDAYIDFEFLQNTLTTTPLVGGTGGFSSAGPNCGRTLNDFLLTLELHQGGTVADFFVERWVAKSGNNSCNPGTSYDYVDVTTPVITATPPAVFAAVNASTVALPPGNLTAFGTNNYVTNTFTEAAVDLTALLGSFDPCLTVGIKTILVKTKESQSPSANIVDFIVPQQLVPPLVIGPTVDAGPDQGSCEDPSGTTSFTLTGTAQPGTYPITSTTWSCVTSCTDVSIASPSNLSTNVSITGAPRTVTLRLTVTDSGTCTNHIRSDDVILTVNNVNASSSNTPILCNGGTSTVTVSATGGTAPYSGTGTFTRSAGTYSFTVTDSKSCTATTTLSITQPSALIASNNHGTIACHGGTTTVTVSASGGTTPYSGTGTFTRSVGTYSFAVTDANSCIATTTGTITEPATSVVATSSNTPILCHGGSSTVTVSATGGTSPYSGTGTFTRSAGTYSFTVTDANSCTSTTTGTITEPTTVVASSSNTAILCHGGSSIVTVSATGGTAPYAGTGTFSHAAGTYSYTVTDSKSCTATTTGTISEPSAVVATSSNTAILCHGGSSTVTVSATGGTAPYSGTGTFSRGAGTYSYTVTDANSCTSTTTGTITEPDAVSASSSNTAILCHGGNSTVTVSATGGTAPYTGTGTFVHAAGTYSYTVTDANSCTSTTTGTITEPDAVLASSSNTAILCHGGNSTVTVSATGGTAPYSGTGTFTHVAGTYSYTVTDANSCTSTATGTITEPDAVVASSSNTAILCHGGSSTVTVSATGGTGPYSGTGTFSVPAGSYSYTVTDHNGCMSTTTGEITEPSAVVASSSNTAILCHGGSSTVTVSATGGTAPYSGTGTFSVPAGPYSYTVTDHNGCVSTTTGDITEPEAVVASSSNMAILCHGGNSTVTVSATGGTAPYSGTGTFSVPAGPYSYTVTDHNGCISTTKGDITEPDAVVATSSNTRILCHGGNSTVTVSATGGTAPYSGTGTFSHPAGTYSYTVTDANSCTSTTTGTITEPSEALSANSSNTPILCNGGSSTVTVSATGGTPPYLGTGTVSRPAGTYSFTVTDANSCTATTTINITQPTAVNANSSYTPILCNGGSSTVTVSATGGTAPYQGTGTVTRSAGTYSYTVTDANGCIATTTGNITQPTALNASSSNTRILCNGGSSTVTVSATGGTAPYQGTGSASRSAGTYSYTVTDANGCAATTTGNITQPSALTLSLSVTACSAGSNGSIRATFSGGTGPYQIKIDNGAYITATSPYNFSGLTPGSHTVTVRDANACTTSNSISVASCPRFCTLTQGAYGNAGGKYTYNGVKYTTTGLLQLLTSPAKGGSIVIGIPGVRSLTITQGAVTCLDGDNSCRLARLPANTTPASLPSNFGNLTLNDCGAIPKCQTAVAIPLQGNGQWQSTLLGQTVTLTLNTRLDPNLPGLVLPSCTSIPATVVSALSNSMCNGGFGSTVQGLLYLANRGLAGQGTCSASLGDITSALNAINTYFNGSGNSNCPSCQQ